MNDETEAFRTATAHLASRGQSLARAIERNGLIDHPGIATALRKLLEAEAAYLDSWMPIWNRILSHDTPPNDLADRCIAALNAIKEGTTHE